MSLDKSTWGEGAWQQEPDRLEFKHAGLPCLMRRSDLGNWCGYAAVPPGHPLHGKHYDAVEIEVHGGLTYAGSCSGEICHIPEPGDPDDVWWFGFDCAHSMDLSPGVRGLFAVCGVPYRDRGDAYRDMAYVRAETERLAEQLIERGKAA